MKSFDAIMVVLLLAGTFLVGGSLIAATTQPTTRPETATAMAQLEADQLRREVFKRDVRIGELEKELKTLKDQQARAIQTLLEKHPE